MRRLPCVETSSLNRDLVAVILLGVGSGVLQSVRAQLTLRQALDDADRLAYGNRIAAANSGAQSAAALVPLKGILPSIRIEAGYIRTTDPIGVFGTTLRQRTITQANFDPQRLNFPAPVGNYQSGIVVEQPIFN